MIKSLAALFLLTAVILAVQSNNVFGLLKLDTPNAQPSVRGIKDARPASRHSSQTKNRRLRASQLSKNSQQALFVAADLELSKADRVQWDDTKFISYLDSLSEDDAKVLVQRLIASKSTGSPLISSAHSRIIPGSIFNHVAHNTKFVVLAGLLDKLASRDFLNTLDFIDHLPEFEHSKFISQALYETVLRAGASQSPKRAWEVYLAKCSTSFG